MAFLQRQASANNKMLVFMWTDDEACQLANKDYEKAKEKVLSVEKTDKLPTFQEQLNSCINDSIFRNTE